MADLITDIMGQVARLPLRPSAENSLLPLYEAVSNSLHAIQDRYGDRGAGQRGEIVIEVTRANTDEDHPPITGFTIRDNGIGFTDDNYASFQRPYTRTKIERGGKGVGRLGWLKVFEDISVHSSYANGSEVNQRAFKFVLRESNQLEPIDYDLCPTGVPGTVVKLHSYIGSFGPQCPKTPETLVQRLIAHFLPVFTSEHPPTIRVVDLVVTDLKAKFDELTIDQHEELVEIELDGEQQPIIIKNMRCDKAIRPRGQKFNWLVFSANDRGVKEYCIDGQLGLGLIGENEIYVGAVTGDFLDATVNPERTNFTISD